MERIRSVRKSLEQRKVEKAIAPIFQKKSLKINFDDTSDKVFEKIVRYYMNLLYRKDEENDEQVFERLGEELKFWGIKFKANKINELTRLEKDKIQYSNIVKTILRYNYTRKTRPAESNWNIYQITMGDEYGTEYKFYTTLDVKISKKFRNYQFQNLVTYQNYFVMDVFRLVAEIKIITDMDKYILLNNYTVKEAIVDSLMFRGIPREWNRTIDSIKNFCNEYKIEVPATDRSEGEFSKYTLNITELLVDTFNGKRIFNRMDDLYSEPLRKRRNLQYLNYNYCVLAKMIYKEMARDNKDLEIESYYENNTETEYARAFETKKNINKEIETLMKDSKFHSYFNYVEYDNETDKEKIKIIEDEFERVSNYLGLEKLEAYIKDRTIRFRKLGKHRASGLYWPDHNCVCVDLDGIHSALHEILHMLDYTSSSKCYLRDIPGFRRISSKYTREMDAIVENFDKKDPFKVNYNGSNKYNRNYYKNRTEIFARCGEIYLSKCLKVDSSLLSTCEGPMYPCSKELLNMIDAFYSKYVFTNVGNELGDIRKTKKGSNELNQLANNDESNIFVESNGQIRLVI